MIIRDEIPSDIPAIRMLVASAFPQLVEAQLVDRLRMDGDSREQVKMKVSFQVDLKIVGFNPGDPNGKHAATFGSLQCETDELGTTVAPLAVGVSGISDKMRKEISENRDNYRGKVVTVESNAVIMARGGTYSLFLPRLIEVRTDKLLADTLAHVKAQFDAAMAGKAVVKAKAK